MKNILDYAKYYKDYSFNEILFNQMDALIYSILVYLPVQKVSDGTKISELSSKINYTNLRGAVGPIAVELLPIIEKSKRYKDIQVYNVAKREDDEVQFGAMTFRNGINTFVAFEGTNASIIGWVENFMLTSEYPTKTQILAIDYLNNTITKIDKTILVGGHSKGGNLAMAASMECNEKIFSRIEKIYNFDGPGFRKQELESEKFKRMNAKTINILPSGSLVGILMLNKNYEYIEAEGVGFKQHYPTSWNVFGEFFENSKQSKASLQIQESLDKSVEELKEDDVKKILGLFAEFFRKNNISNTSDIKAIKFDEFRAMIRDIKDIDENSKKLFFEIVKILINPDNNWKYINYN